MDIMYMYKNKINKLRSLPKTGFFPTRATGRFMDPEAVVPLDARNNSIEPPRQSFGGGGNFTFGGGNVEMVRQSRPTITNAPPIQRMPSPVSFSDRNVFAAEPVFTPARFTENIVPTTPARPIVNPGAPIRSFAPAPAPPVQSFSDFRSPGFFNDSTVPRFAESRVPAGPAQIIAPQDMRPATRTPTLSSIGQTTAPAVNVQELARQLANDIIAENARLSAATKKGRIYTRFERNNDIIEDQIETITSAIWSSGAAQLTTFFTSSFQTTAQRRYYVEVYNGVPTATSSLPQLSIAYGHALGSGSDSAANMYNFPSQAVYYQYRQLLLDPSATRFVTQGSGSTDSIYAITFNRSCIKERIDPGNFEFSMKSITSRSTNATGSVVLGAASTIQTFIDDSSINTNPSKGAMGRVYNLVSGSLIRGVFNPSAPVYYGTVYPEYGVIIADGNVLDLKLNFQTNKGMNSEGNNHFAMFRAISGSAYEINTLTSDTLGFYARNSERITSTHYFVRVKNSDYNFSNNPSYVSGSDGQIDQDTFIGDPKTYITTVGLYNDRTELIAVAKLSKPLLKSYSREALIRVKLDF